jgi:hypothetical protein
MSKPCENCGSDFKVCISCDLYNGKYIEIPDNATNGDVIKAMFPKAKINDNKFLEHIYASVNGTKLVDATVDARRSWWDAPYNGESEAKESI